MWDLTGCGGQIPCSFHVGMETGSADFGRHWYPVCIKGDNTLLASKKQMMPSQNVLIMFIWENDSGEMEGEQKSTKQFLADEH